MDARQWARVFAAGCRQLETANGVMLSSSSALGMALEAMSDECDLIARESEAN